MSHTLSLWPPQSESPIVIWETKIWLFIILKKTFAAGNIFCVWWLQEISPVIHEMFGSLISKIYLDKSYPESNIWFHPKYVIESKGRFKSGDHCMFVMFSRPWGSDSLYVSALKKPLILALWIFQFASNICKFPRSWQTLKWEVQRSPAGNSTSPCGELPH